MKSNIYFGKVVSVDDDETIFRTRIHIEGYTEKIEIESLPWYYPFYGINYLPVVNDVVPVIIFDNNFSTGFYCQKIDILSRELTEEDYANYLEIYKRDDVELIYKLSTGIEFINKDSKIQIEKDKLSIFVENNSIVITNDRIDIGNQNLEATPLGDKTVEMFEKTISHIDELTNSILTLFKNISGVCTNPYTLPIKTIITANEPVIKTKLGLLVKSNKEFTKLIQSKKVFIE